MIRNDLDLSLFYFVFIHQLINNPKTNVYPGDIVGGRQSFTLKRLKKGDYSHIIRVINNTTISFVRHFMDCCSLCCVHHPRMLCERQKSNQSDDDASE